MQEWARPAYALRSEAPRAGAGWPGRGGRADEPMEAGEPVEKGGVTIGPARIRNWTPPGPGRLRGPSAMVGSAEPSARPPRWTRPAPAAPAAHEAGAKGPASGTGRRDARARVRQPSLPPFFRPQAGTPPFLRPPQMRSAVIAPLCSQALAHSHLPALPHLTRSSGDIKAYWLSRAKVRRSFVMQSTNGVAKVKFRKPTAWQQMLY
jgi:hypothetical protein